MTSTPFTRRTTVSFRAAALLAVLAAATSLAAATQPSSATAGASTHTCAASSEPSLTAVAASSNPASAVRGYVIVAPGAASFAERRADKMQGSTPPRAYVLSASGGGSGYAYGYATTASGGRPLVWTSQPSAPGLVVATGDDDEEEGEDDEDDIVTIDLMGDEGETMVMGSDDEPGKDKKSVRRIVIGARGRTFLGVGVAEIDSDRAKELHLRDERGVEVRNVEDGSPAHKAGVREGDVVLEYNGERIEGTTQFIRMVRETPSGREVKLVVWRDGATRTLNPTLATRKPKVFKWSKDFHGNGPDGDDDSHYPQVYEFEMPEINIPEINIPEFNVPEGGLMAWRGPRLGIESDSLTPQLAEFFGVKDGVLVRTVIKGSAAEKAGLKAGDVIQKVDGTKVSGQGEISSILRSLDDGATVAIVLVRSGREMTVNAKLEPLNVKKRSSLVPRVRGTRQPFLLRGAGARI